MRRRRGWLAWLLVLGAGVVVLGCRCRKSETAEEVGARPTAPSASAQATAVELPDFSPGPPPATSRLARDSLWKEAQGGELLDLQRLANREGAAGLLEGVELGGSWGLTALAALPYADDSELALRRLCQILSFGDPKKLEPVVRAVHGVVSRPPKPVEPLDPVGYRLCATALDQLKDKPGLSVAGRDLAASATQMLGEHIRVK